MGYRRTYNRLTVGTLTPEQHAKTCGYWYVVQHQHMAHTAFATLKGLQQWAEERGLTLPQMADKGTWSWGDIQGSYSDESHMSREDFEALRPSARHAVTLSNGNYTRALIHDENGHKVVHYCNPNVRDRETFDYFKARELTN